MYKKNMCPMMNPMMLQGNNPFMCQMYMNKYKPQNQMYPQQIMDNNYMQINDPQPNMMYFEEDEMDEMYFMDMYSQNCKKMMKYIDSVLDNMEDNDECIYAIYIDKGMIRIMIDDAYEQITKNMKLEQCNCEDSRQYGGNRVLRDFVGVLLLGELGRRRRRRRRFPYYGYPGYGKYPGGKYKKYGRSSYDESISSLDCKDYFCDLD